jgi:periplasmic protein TonB
MRKMREAGGGVKHRTGLCGRPVRLKARQMLIALAAALALQAPIRSYELPPPPTPKLPPTPAPVAPPARLPEVAADMLPITNADYPTAALRAREQGRVHVFLHITDLGRVDRCTVTRSSGSASLDAASCRLLLERGRFEPALDHASRPVAWHKAMVVTWSLGASRR